MGSVAYVLVSFICYGFLMRQIPQIIGLKKEIFKNKKQGKDMNRGCSVGAFCTQHNITTLHI